MIENEQILCLTMSDWDEPMRCRHHLMYILSEAQPVVWVEKSVSFKFFTLKKAGRFLAFLRPPLEAKKNLFVITPPPLLPFLDKLPVVDKVNSFILLRYLKYRLRRLDFSPTVFWSFSCFTSWLAGKFDETVSIYYCNDPFEDSPYEIKKEAELCRKVDLVLTASDQLTAKKSKLNPNTHTILHGVNKDYFFKDSYPVPPEMVGMKKPVIGYCGPIKEHIDLELIQYVARKRPQWTFVFIGPMAELTPEQRKQWEELSLPNVRLLGGRPITALADYINACDVLTLPYHVDKNNAEHYNRHCQIPLKVFEYFSSGKPLVSTVSYPGIGERFCYVAEGYDDFLSLLEKAMQEDSPARRRERRDLARPNTWQARIEQIGKYIVAVRKKRFQT